MTKFNPCEMDSDELVEITGLNPSRSSDIVGATTNDSFADVAWLRGKQVTHGLSVNDTSENFGALSSRHDRD